MKSIFSLKIAYVFPLIGLLSCESQMKKIEETKVEFDPFANHNGDIPDKTEYNGPLYKANFDYPKELPKINSSTWDKIADGKKLTLKNAGAYMEAIHDFVAKEMSIMVNEPKRWINSEEKKNWYNMAWAGQHFSKTGWDGAEPISGTLTGQVLRKEVFKEYGYNGPMQNHVTVYYNNVAAHTLHKLWKEKDPNGFYPTYTTEAAQFAQNSIIIKAAATDVTPEQWPVLKGTSQLQVYRPIVYGPNKTEKSKLQTLNWIQFDIIIKDTIAAPETGWVFATYIYDASSKGKTTFDRLTLQGVMWGMDTEINDGTSELTETFLNPKAPQYGMANIGFGNRLSGPIDVAKVGGEHADGKINKVFVLNEKSEPEGGVTYDMYRASSCLSCHSTASYPHQNNFYASPKFKLVYTDTVFHSKSEGWKTYNTNRPGNKLMPSVSGNNRAYMALDYDLFLFFALTNSGQVSHMPKEFRPTPPKNYNQKWLDKKSHPLFN
ncbi:MAG: hypothetical protein KJ941_05575 [Bacteroidetes bacterium]|nr:hypothetical protein [Bacteroidota bacterium]